MNLCQAKRLSIVGIVLMFFSLFLFFVYIYIFFAVATTEAAAAVLGYICSICIISY